MFFFSTMYAILAVMVVVLPVPAPARMSWGDGDDGYVDECSGYYGVPGMSFILQSKCSGIFHIQRPAGY